MAGRPGLGRVLAVSGLVIAALVVTVALARADGDDGTYEVAGVFESVRGLVSGAEVRTGGFPVGKVERIELPRGGNPRVTMAIDEDYRIRRGAIADLRLASQAGQLNRFIAIAQGDGPQLEDGATLGIARTDQPVEFDEALSFLTPRTRRQVQDVVRNLDRATDGHGPDLDRTLRNSGDALSETAGLLDEVTADGAALSTLVDQGSAVVDTLASEPAELQGTVEALASVLDATAARQGDLSESLGLLPAGLRSPRLALEELDRSIPNLRTLVADARPALAQAVPLARELRPSIRTARPAIKSARRLADPLPAQLRAARGLLARTGPIIDDLGPAFEGLNPALDHLRASAPDSLGWLTLLGDSLANYDLNGHGGRLMLVATGPENREIAPSDDAGGFVRRPFDRTPGVLAGEPWRDYEDSFIGGGKPVESFLTPEELAARGSGGSR